MLARKRGCVKTKTSVVPVALRWQETKELNPAVRASVSLMDRTASLHAAGQDHARRVEFEDFPLTPATLDIFHLATRIMWTIPENGFGFPGNTHKLGLTAAGGVRGSNITRNTGVRLTFGR